MSDPPRTLFDAHLLLTGMSTAAAARVLGVTYEAVRLWRRGDRRPILTLDQARAIESKTGIPPHVLRPDLWPPEPQLPTRRRYRRSIGGDGQPTEPDPKRTSAVAA